MRYQFSIKKELWLNRPDTSEQKGSWEVRGWSACRSKKNNDCTGKKVQVLECKTPAGNSHRAKHANEICGKKPKAKSQPCIVDDYKCQHQTPYEWRPMTPWGSCSVTCGTDGIETRRVGCTHVSSGKTVSGDKCIDSDQILSTRPCAKPIKCPSRWVASEWSECVPTQGR